MHTNKDREGEGKNLEERSGQSTITKSGTATVAWFIAGTWPHVITINYTFFLFLFFLFLYSFLLLFYSLYFFYLFLFFILIPN